MGMRHNPNRPPEVRHLRRAVPQQQALGRPHQQVPGADDGDRRPAAGKGHEAADGDRGDDEARQVDAPHACESRASRYMADGCPPPEPIAAPVWAAYIHLMLDADRPAVPIAVCVDGKALSENT